MPSTRELDTGEYMALVADAETVPPALSAAVHIDLGALTHPGKVRTNNEDHFLAVRFGRSLQTLKTNLSEAQVPRRFDEVGYGLVVADGMGGAAAGEVASSLAISVGLNLTLNSPKWILKATPEEIRESMENWRQRFRQIDFILAERAESDPALAGMGTTLTIACSVGADLLLYYVGDSRAYLFRGGHLHRLTRDHTMAQALADAGWIGPEEVARHRLRHVLTRVLGRGDGHIEVEIQHMKLADGDRLLLCTDGLSDMVSDEQIAAVLARTEGSEDACRALVDLALAAGGRDNVTVVLANYAMPDTVGAAPAAPMADMAQ
jgi:protein phosphatase